MRKAILLLPLLAGVATPALAQVTARVEARIGYDEPRAKVSVARTLRSDEMGVGDLGFGAEAGVDATLGGGFLVGGYGGIDFGTPDGCGQELFFTDDELCLEARRNLYAGLRAGLRTGDNGLIYIKGGFSRGKFRASYFDGEDEVLAGSDNLAGYHLGGGFELDVQRNFYLKGEYVYTHYNDAFTDVLDDPPEQHFQVTRHQLMFGVGLRFGVGDAPVAPPPPPPVTAPPPPPEAAATQTCSNGSVILATDVCPAPPPPPPPPSGGERG